MLSRERGSLERESYQRERLTKEEVLLERVLIREVGLSERKFPKEGGLTEKNGLSEHSRFLDSQFMYLIVGGQTLPS